jgi:alpha-L-rhamnosidase
VLVESSKALLESSIGDLRDSGKVVSRAGLGIIYDGRPLGSRQRCWWCVRIWDETDRPSEYSEAGSWEIGLLDDAQWHAQWLAIEDERARDDRRAGLHWIWAARREEQPSRRFRLTFTLPARASHGMILVGSKNRLHSLWLDDKPLPVDRPPRHAVGTRPLTEIDLQELSAGRHVIAVEVHSQALIAHHSPPGMAALIRLDLVDGATMRLTTGPQWRTSSGNAPNWFAADYDDQDWEPAVMSAPLPNEPWPPTAAMHLRKEFVLERPVAYARLYASALGAYESRMNGKRVGDALLTPECSHFNKRALYRVYDVTSLLQQGRNVLGLTVGDGWYASVFNGIGRYAFDAPPRRAVAQLEMTFADGSRQIVATDADWRIGCSGIVRSEIFAGEVYDARLEPEGWDTIGFEDSAWERPAISPRPACRLVAQITPPIRATEILRPRAITQPASGSYVVDFGQNFAGWCRLHATGRAGTRIELQFGELLLPCGNVDRSNLRDARQTDVFILRGAGRPETFEPRFTYHGFRYVQITGLDVEPTASSIEGIVVHTDLERTGGLSIGQPLLERIWRNTVWTQRSNFTGVPTDCPQRDERRAYLADSGVFWDAAAFSMDVAAFSRRYMDDVCDSQTAEGVFQTHAPTPLQRRDPFPGWADNAIVLTWTAWRRYGDSSIVERHWDNLQRHVQFLLDHNPDCIWRNRRADYGDWLCVDAKYMGDQTTPHDLIGTAYWAHDLALLAEMAEATRRPAEAARLRAVRERVRQAFIDTFVHADGRVGNGSQTCYVLALKYDLVPSNLRLSAAERLAADIRRRGSALSTGILGTQHILDVLADTGQSELAYDLLLRTDYPSWGYMIAQGATTMWESWNGRVWSGLHGDATTMPNSCNHFALGSVCGFLFRRVVGIDASSPGFATIVIHPMLDKRVRYASGYYDSAMGRISIHWTLTTNGEFSLNVAIPANATAHVHLPTHQDRAVTESGQQIFGRTDLRVLTRIESVIVVEIGSGSYRFHSHPDPVTLRAV